MKRTIAAVTIMVLVLSVTMNILTVPAKADSIIFIRPDGSIEGTNLILKEEDTYTLIGNLSNSIHVQRSNIILDGAGYAINGNGEGTGIDLSNDVPVDSSRAQISNVTVKNVVFTNWFSAVDFVPSTNNTFVNNCLKDCYGGFNIWWTSNNTLTHNTVENCFVGVTINFGGGNNIVIENTIINSSVGIMKPPENIVDKNYWSDYLTKISKRQRNWNIRYLEYTIPRQ